MKNFALLAVASAGLFLASCDQNPPPSALLALSGTVVEGELTGTEMAFQLRTQAWSGGAGRVAGYLVTGDELPQQPAAVGTLAADGRFVLTLPTPAATQLAPLDTDLFGSLPEGYDFAADCLPQLAVSDRSARSAGLLVAVEAGKEGPVSPLTFSSEGTPGQGRLNVSFGGLVYVDRSVTLQGSRTCTSPQGERLTVQADLRLGKGWNKVQFTVTADERANTASVSAVSGAFSSDNWVYLKGELSGQSLGRQLPRPAFLGR
ncbi:hypothetical protein [Deinococcus murrayi]|uniref:hypothetical protein n=1 Tax=Deinococcus murrayi TaxID=68910 RepID=UPI00047FAEF4|nr:hypothetical protein [Deinococcus murrayi]